MSLDPKSYQAAVMDFQQARRTGALQEIVARLTGKSADLLSYEDVQQKLRLAGRSDRGLQEIPLDAIVGTVGRYHDFTRTFLPLNSRDEQRWASVKHVVDQLSIDALPPIEVYKIDQAYFVLDGHHRVSVARRHGLSTIHADVTEVRTKVPLAPDVTPDDLIIKAEYAGFLEATRLADLRPDVDLSVTVPGQYRKLEDHIEVQRYFVEEAEARDLPYDEAACRWYDEVYLPTVQVIRERGILRDFPARTETDFYVWVVEHRLELQRELGWQVPTEAATAALAARFSRRPAKGLSRLGRTLVDTLTPAQLRRSTKTGQWRRTKLIDRYSDRLFGDILVPLSGDGFSWRTLEQGLLVAQHEDAQIFGLHIVADEMTAQSDAVQQVRSEFEARCEAAGISGSLIVEADNIADGICERSVLADLVVLSLAHPPGTSPIARLGSGFSSIVRRSARPILAVPGDARTVDRVLLAYDGSVKAKEALFVATYLAERWPVQLAVITLHENDRAAGDIQDFARKYLEMHEVQAVCVRERGPAAEAVLKTAGQLASDLIVMGGYGYKPVVEVVLGSTVNRVLRESDRPVLICR